MGDLLSQLGSDFYPSRLGNVSEGLDDTGYASDTGGLVYDQYESVSSLGRLATFRDVRQVGHSLLCPANKAIDKYIDVECDGVKKKIQIHNAPVEIPLEKRVKEVIQETMPSVVSLHMTGIDTDEKTGESRAATWVGTGFVVDSYDLDLFGYTPKPGETLIATNYHVAHGADVVEMQTFDDSIFVQPTKILIANKEKDIAILVMQTGKEKMNSALIGAPRDVEQGDFVLAFGQPYGLPFRVTSGIVNNANIEGEGAIQTDAAINPGNSGGPLVDLSTGYVVGMDTFIYAGANTMGFAKPIWQQFKQLQEDWDTQLAENVIKMRENDSNGDWFTPMTRI